MIAFLSKRLVRWALMAMAIPLTVWAADAVAQRLEGGRGPSRVTRALKMPGHWHRGESLLAE
jgi:hypothetical protein